VTARCARTKAHDRRLPGRPRSARRVAIGRLGRRVRGDRNPPVGDGLGVPFAVDGTDRGRTRDRDRTLRRRSCGRPRSAVGPGPDDPSLRSGRSRAAGSGRRAWARGGRRRTSSQRRMSVVAPPKGRSSGRAVLTRPTAVCPRANRRCTAVDIHHPPAEAGIGRTSRALHGCGWSVTRGAVQAQSQRHEAILAC
jgi:hypothetical protein